MRKCEKVEKGGRSFGPGPFEGYLNPLYNMRVKIRVKVVYKIDAWTKGETESENNLGGRKDSSPLELIIYN